MKADLHLHSSYSDGIYSPTTIIKKAIEKGFKVISITDHDSIKVYENLNIKSIPGLDIIPGIEMSADYKGKEFHFLGYFINVNDLNFLKIINSISEKRIERVKQIIFNLNNAGIEIKFEEIDKNNVIGRLHIARLLYKKGYVKSVQESFEKYLNKDSRFYVTHPKYNPYEIIDILKANGAVVVWAHPFYSNYDEILPELIKHGLDGIEAYHKEHSLEIKKKYFELAKKNNLIITGGSDWHGDNDSWDFDLPKYCIKDLYRRKEKIND